MSSSKIEFNAVPIKKCPGVRTLRSFISDDKEYNGLVFKMASTWTITVYNSSKVKGVSLITVFK